MTNSIFMEFLASTLDILLSAMSFILTPIYQLIDAYMPNIDTFFSSIAEYFDYASTYIGYLLDAFLIPGPVLTLIYGYFLFRFSVQFGAWLVKRTLIWAVIMRVLGPKVV